MGENRAKSKEMIEAGLQKTKKELAIAKHRRAKLVYAPGNVQALFPGVLHWQTSCPLNGADCPQMIFPLYIDYIIVSSFSLPLQSLKAPKSKIFVDISTLEEWYKKGILDDVNECFEIKLPVQQQKVVEGERLSWNKRKDIYDKLEKLKLVLNKIAEDGKLKWCADAEKEDWNWKYSNLVISAITTMMQKGIENDYLEIKKILTKNDIDIMDKSIIYVALSDGGLREQRGAQANVQSRQFP